MTARFRFPFVVLAQTGVPAAVGVVTNSRRARGCWLAQTGVPAAVGGVTVVAQFPGRIALPDGRARRGGAL